MSRLTPALFLVTGCNWVFGLDPTLPADAPADAVEIRTNLVWAIATTDGMLDGSGIDPTLAYAPIGSEAARPGTPTIQIGDDQGVSETTYDTSDGSFAIPYRLREAPHRIVYTLPGEALAHEIQWAVSGAYITIPRTTRLDAIAPPPGSGYTIMPAGMMGTPFEPTIATSGAFAYDDVLGDFENAAGTFTYRFAAKAKAIDGPVGAPQTGHGDWILVTNWGAITSTQSSVVGWALTNVDLMSNMLSTPAMPPVWNTTLRTMSSLPAACPQNCWPIFNTSAVQLRMTSALGGLASTASFSGHMTYGVSPSLELPGFMPGRPPDYVDRPRLIPLAESSTQDATVMVADPTAMLGLDRVVFSRIASSRSADGVTLTSTLQVVTNVFSGAMTYPAAIPTNIRFAEVPLSTATEHVAIPSSSSAKRLDFAPDAGGSADDYVVSLYEIASGALAPVRVYHALSPSVLVDSSLLASGHIYVFGVTARKGLPGADRGDYHRASYPFGNATTFSNTFVIQ